VPHLPSDSDSIEFAAELLDQSSLNTVLDMVEAIETAEELALLETLTLAQKRQVWQAIPDDQKLRLRKIRETSVLLPSTQPSAKVGSFELEEESLQTDLQIEDAEDLTEPLEAELAENLAENLEDITQSRLEQPMPRVGDRVVLLPKPQLTAADLIAIWDVVAIQADHAKITAERLGIRRYPLSWLVIYPDPEF
jgi:hypothetical protein